MKLPNLSSIPLTLALALGGLGLVPQASLSQPAPGQRGFWCDITSGVPTTTYQNSQGMQEPWIRWVSNYFSGSGYDPITRCQEVSARLETYRVNRQLKFITVGYINRQPVICTASEVNGRCEGLIFTLKPGQDAVRTLNTFLAWREGQPGAPSLRESGQIPYIDVSGHLEEDLDIAPGNSVIESNPTDVSSPVVTPETTDSDNSEGEDSGGLREL